MMRSFLGPCLLALWSVIASADDVKLTLANLSDEVVSISWINPEDPDNPVPVGEISPGEGFKINTFVGHSFAYESNGQRHMADVETSTPTPVLIGPTHFRVECSTTTGTLNIHVLPEWSPIGAARFIDLVKMGHFEGCALNRVVPNFLTQFGISADFDQRTSFRSKSIMDDDPYEGGVAFQPGYMAYAGSGPDSRTTEMFIVMPNAPARQLQAFGQNPWETPFGYVEPQDVQAVVAKWYAYGDMPPWGKGPDPQKIYREDGYEYLKTSFPKMSYIETCKIVSSDYGGAAGVEEEEL